MDEPDATLSVGEVARRCGTTVRTLQHYDRIGLLTADRDDAGRRAYGRRHLARLQQILLLSGAGLRLTEIGTELDRQADRPAAEVFAAQAERLELAELRLRSRRTVIDAVADVLARHPGAVVPAEALTAVITLDSTLLRYPELDLGTEPPALDEDEIAAVITGYFAWKSLAVRALIMIANDVPADSRTGRLLGREQQAMVRALADQSPEVLAVHTTTETAHDRWPAGDRDLHRQTKEFLDQCERAHLDRPDVS